LKKVAEFTGLHYSTISVIAKRIAAEGMQASKHPE